MEPIKVVMLTSSYPRYPGDTASIFLKHMCASLNKKGIVVHVVAPASNNIDKQLDDGVHVHRFHYLPRKLRKLCYGSGILPNLKNNPLLWISVPFYLVSMFLMLIKVVRATNADIVHCHWIIPQGFIALLSRPFHRAAIIVTAHGADAFSFKSRITRIIKNYTIGNANCWTANTGVTAEAVCKSIPSSNLSIIPMGVDTDFFKDGNGTRLRSNLAPDTSILLFVGRLVEKKGVSVLLKAFSLLPTRNRERTRLWIVGDGGMRSELETEAEKLRITKQTTFWGKQPNETLPDFFAASNIFVGPSLIDSAGDTEGQGVVFLEAFASGTPIIASRVGGIPDVIKHEESGILVSPRNPDELSNAITRLLNDSKLRIKIAEAGNSVVREIYDWDSISIRFRELYDTVLPEGRL